MPIALLLQEAIKALVTGAKKLSPWLTVVALEELLIARARSAFVVHWFGADVPLRDLYLRVAISNLDALRERYREVSERVRHAPRGPGLMEPAAGLLGTAVGILFSPSGAILGVYGLIRYLLRTGGDILGILGAIIGGPLVTALGAAAGVLLLPVGLVLGLGSGLFQRGVLFEVHGLSVSLYRTIRVAVDFLDQILGPRERVRNPLVRQILEVLDRLAILFAQVLGAVAVIVTRIGPLVVPLAKQAVLLGRLAGAVGDVLRTLVREIGEVWQRLAPDIMPLVTTLRRVATTFPTRVRGIFTRHLTRLLQRWASTLLLGAIDLFFALLPWLARVATIIDRAILRHWTVRGILAATRQVQTIQRALRSTPAASRGGGGASGGGTGGGTSLPFLPPLPAAPSLPDVASIERQAGVRPPPLTASAIEHLAEKYRIEGGGAAVVFSAEAKRAVERARRSPTSVFAGERERLREEHGAAPRAALSALRDQELRLRALLSTVVTRVLPPEVRIYLPELQRMFAAVDRDLYLQPGAAAVRGAAAGAEGGAEFPVLQLPDNQRLRLVVRRLTVRSTSGEPEDLRELQQQLVRSLSSQPYRALAGT